MPSWLQWALLAMAIIVGAGLFIVEGGNGPCFNDPQGYACNRSSGQKSYLVFP